MRTRTKRVGDAIESGVEKALRGQVARAFDMMGVAEEEIARAWPRRSLEPARIFMFLMPTAILRGLGFEVYRAHVRELVERAKGDELPTSDWVRLTRAEVIGILYEASSRHPLKHHDACVYEELFAEVLPDLARKVGVKRVHLAEEAVEIRRTIDEWLSRESPERAATMREQDK